VATHLPAAHEALPFWGTGQALLHAPQLATFDERSTHAEAHDVVPLGHVVTHAPAEQASLTPHLMPQPPQLLGLVAGSMHALPHLAKPALHVKPHLPALHSGTPNAGTSHFKPHAPQFKGSFAVATHCPAHSV
jgi:hypothetical protein